MIHDVAIVGGGVIGLSLAWVLAERGQRVVLLDRGPLGGEASWAGAGILPPGPDLDVLSRHTEPHSFDRLRAESAAMHEQWALRLKEQTGIDNGYRRCGGWYFARRPGEAAALRGWRLSLEEEGILFHYATADEVASQLPRVATDGLRVAMMLPGEAQIRNPHHLRALAVAGARLGVDQRPACAVRSVEWSGGAIRHLETDQGPLVAGRYCFTAGAWTYPLLRSTVPSLEVVPIRGQMILYKTQRPLVRQVLNEGSRYLVPRDDGYLLAGSSEEEAGYDKSTTDEMLHQLRQFATGWLPELGPDQEVKAWAGLRPGSADGFPYLDRLPDCGNAFVAAGHFRSGLYLSPATATAIASWMLEGKAAIDLAPFGILRK